MEIEGKMRFQGIDQGLTHLLGKGERVDLAQHLLMVEPPLRHYWVMDCGYIISWASALVYPDTRLS